VFGSEGEEILKLAFLVFAVESYDAILMPVNCLNG
jgi:hypothetical protein